MFVDWNLRSMTIPEICWDLLRSVEICWIIGSPFRWSIVAPSWPSKALLWRFLATEIYSMSENTWVRWCKKVQKRILMLQEDPKEGPNGSQQSTDAGWALWTMSRKSRSGVPSTVWWFWKTVRSRNLCFKLQYCKLYVVSAQIWYWILSAFFLNGTGCLPLFTCDLQDIVFPDFDLDETDLGGVLEWQEPLDVSQATENPSGAMTMPMKRALYNQPTNQAAQFQCFICGFNGLKLLIVFCFSTPKTRILTATRHFDQSLKASKLDVFSWPAFFQFLAGHVLRHLHGGGYRARPSCCLFCTMSLHVSSYCNILTIDVLTLTIL